MAHQPDPTVIPERTLNLGALGEYPLVEFTRSRKRAYAAAFDALQAIENPDEDDNDLEAAYQIGRCLEAATANSDELATRVQLAYKDDEISDGFLARALQAVVDWRNEVNTLGNA